VDENEHNVVNTILPTYQGQHWHCLEDILFEKSVLHWIYIT